MIELKIKQVGTNLQLLQDNVIVASTLPGNGTYKIPDLFLTYYVECMKQNKALKTCFAYTKDEKLLITPDNKLVLEVPMFNL